MRFEPHFLVTRSIDKPLYMALLFQIPSQYQLLYICPLSIIIVIIQTLPGTIFISRSLLQGQLNRSSRPTVS